MKVKRNGISNENQFLFDRVQKKESEKPPSLASYTDFRIFTSIALVAVEAFRVTE